MLLVWVNSKTLDFIFTYKAFATSHSQSTKKYQLVCTIYANQLFSLKELNEAARAQKTRQQQPKLHINFNLISLSIYIYLCTFLSSVNKLLNDILLKIKCMDFLHKTNDHVWTFILSLFTFRLLSSFLLFLSDVSVVVPYGFHQLYVDPVTYSEFRTESFMGVDCSRFTSHV